MVSRTDGGGQDFEDWASVHGRLLPWSDDQTTATYQPAQLRYLRRYAYAAAPKSPSGEVSESPWLGMSTNWDSESWSIQLGDAEGLVPSALHHAGRQAQQVNAGASRPGPNTYVERLQPAAAQLPPLVSPGYDAAEDPFEHARGNAGAWIRTLAVTAGLFAALLFTRVLLHAGASEPERTPPPPAASAATLPPPVQVTQPSVATGLEANTDQPKGVRSSARVPVAARPKSSDAPSGTPGTLRINARPWAQVFVDGRFVGNTPQFGISVSPGKHSLRLVNPEFGMVKTISLNVGAGETVTRVEMLEQ